MTSTPTGCSVIEAFAKSVGALVMGSTTYEWIAGEPARRLDVRAADLGADPPAGHHASGHPVRAFDGEVTELHPQLVRRRAVRDVWVVGGGDVAAQFVAAGLVDEMIVSYAPCSLGTGARSCRRIRSGRCGVGRNGDFVCASWRRA